MVAKNYLPHELKRIDGANISEKSKKLIKDFLKESQIRDNLSDNRLYFYSVLLRVIATDMGDKFINPTDKDVMNVISDMKEKRNYSDGSIEAVKITLKKFYRWMGKEDAISWIKRNSKPNYKRKPDFVISQGDTDLLIASCDNARDKAIFSLLYDTGIRIGELLTLRIKDVVFDDYGMKLMVTGKTGTRVVRAIGDSVGYVKAWLNVHPDQFNEDAILFCKMKDPDAMMDHIAVYMMFKKVKNRAIAKGFSPNKRINPHKFRHNRATQLATRVKESVLEREMGWVPSSQMTKIYIHLNDEDVDNAILESQGIKVEKKIDNVRKSRTCIYCKSPNPATAKFCLQCGRPLDYDEVKLLDERVQKVETALKESDLISEDEKMILESMPSDTKDTLVAVLLKTLRDKGKLDDLKKYIK